MSRGETIAFGVLIPILVILSGVFAGLTLGYMSLDETQLNVLSISGTPKQKLYANKIKPIRKDGHLLLVTLLLANMIVNETLPVIADPILGGGVQSVVVSTVLIVIFSEIIPQSLCTRYGLYFGAKMAPYVRVLIWTLGIVAYPVAKLLELVLGPHHGIIYRRAELKELIAMHSNVGELGGDLNRDTVTIIGGALDLQEKVVKQAMTPIEDAFMLSIDSRLDFETLRKICRTGHSRIPVYEEVEIPAPALVMGAPVSNDIMNAPIAEVRKDGPTSSKMVKAKRIVGILLVKQCVLLDPKEATPVRKIPLNKVPLVPHNEPLLGILDKFQDGRSHMAIVSRFSVERAASVKQAVKRGLTQRLKETFQDSDSDDESSESETEGRTQSRWKRFGRRRSQQSGSENEETLREEASDDAGSRTSGGGGRSKRLRAFGTRGRRKQKATRLGDVDLEMGVVEGAAPQEDQQQQQQAAGSRSRLPSIALPRMGFWGNEQNVPADAVLSTEGAEELLQSMDPAVMPLGIITLEDVLEELIGEEIYDEFDPQGHPDLSSYAGAGGEPKPKPKLMAGGILRHRRSAPQLAPQSKVTDGTSVAPGIQVSSSVPASSADGLAVSPSASPTPKTPTLPVVKPTAMHTLPLRGLNALNLKGIGSRIARSRSAPPTPRDETASEPGEVTPTVPEGIVVVTPAPAGAGADHELSQESPVIFMDAAQLTSPQPVVSVPQVINAESVARAKLSPPQSPVPLTVNALATASKPTSRSSSPSPSLEQAILIERKRRAASAGAGSMPLPKGARFKSSPLTGERLRKQLSEGGEAVVFDEKEEPEEGKY
ncbi:hypothetical protein POSPLADRAFT_1180890 [Postia placenta MAD-698-R-SB12]|uniref:CNNM transmembrane domain-containing protein n=1 Tax=Postia placenta MAD-698-R-SB12 TaxID=670580 RepID=A0A1X6N2F3_9APHY|nr:hypothetical protein POSPLADRAFT_1180890 [Postia placenta MAD-698-R-SB12]OSX62805.1 hypothetical protein POSPLADRAFT_1180890 [Postia placenta MAD-698-R-SB12]